MGVAGLMKPSNASCQLAGGRHLTGAQTETTCPAKCEPLRTCQVWQVSPLKAPRPPDSRQSCPPDSRQSCPNPRHSQRRQRHRRSVAIAGRGGGAHQRNERPLSRWGVVRGRFALGVLQTRQVSEKLAGSDSCPRSRVGTAPGRSASTHTTHQSCPNPRLSQRRQRHRRSVAIAGRGGGAHQRNERPLSRWGVVRGRFHTCQVFPKTSRAARTPVSYAPWTVAQ